MKKYRIVKETGEISGTVSFYVQEYLPIFFYWRYLMVDGKVVSFETQAEAQKEIDALRKLYDIQNEKIIQEIIDPE